MMMHNDSSFSNSDSESGGQNGKMFVGGLHLSTNTETLRAYFSQFGEIVDCVIKRDTKTNCSRGFGFVIYANANDLEKVFAVSDHFLDGKKIDPQPAIHNVSPARSVHYVYKKLFIGGISQETTVEDLKGYFNANFGEVEDVILKIDYPKKNHRGFGFITFVQDSVADLVAATRYHTIRNKIVETKQAQKKEFVNWKPIFTTNFVSTAPPGNRPLCGLVSNNTNEDGGFLSAPNVVLGQPLTNQFFDANETNFRKRLVAKYVSRLPPPLFN